MKPCLAKRSPVATRATTPGLIHGWRSRRLRVSADLDGCLPSVSSSRIVWTLAVSNSWRPARPEGPATRPQSLPRRSVIVAYDRGGRFRLEGIDPMHADVNGTRLWFDVDGPVLAPDGSQMRQRPTVVLVHGGPGGLTTRTSSRISLGWQCMRRLSISICVGTGGRPGATLPTGASRRAPMTSARSATRSG